MEGHCKLILYGCGNLGIKWLKHLGEENVYALADSDLKKIGKNISGKKVLSIDELVRMKDAIRIYISTTGIYKGEIFQILSEAGLNENIVGLPYKDVYAEQNIRVDMETVFEGRNAVANGVGLKLCELGYASYIAANTSLYNVKIGRYSSIGPNIRNIIGQHPTRKFVSTNPMFYSTQKITKKSYVAHNIFEENRYTENGYSAEIGNDVWIGDGVTIMEGVKVADGTIVAAETNVVKDTEPYTIVGGNPSRLIRYRFDEEDIKFLEQLQWWNKPEPWIDEHAKYFSDVKKFISIVKKEESNF